MKKENYNIIIAGVGGQGLITLLQVLAQAALNKGFDVKSSELHGLSQRGGSVAVHIRIGKNIFSPIISQGKADLVLALESQEALNALGFANKETMFLINSLQTPTLCENINESQIKRQLEKFAGKVLFVPADAICKEKLQSAVVSGMFILGLALSHNILPLSLEDIKEAVKQTMAQKYQQINIDVLGLSAEYN